MRKIYVIKATLLFSATLFAFIFVKAQDIATDGKGEYIFSIPSPKKFEPRIDARSFGLSFRTWQFRRKLYYIKSENVDDKYDVPSGDTAVYTMAKSWNINFNLIALNNNSNGLLYNSLNNLTPTIEVGVNWGFDSLINPTTRHWYLTFSASPFFTYQHFKVYDTTQLSNPRQKINRPSFGLRLSTNIFRRTAYAISLSVAYQKLILTDDLTSFQNKPNRFYVNNDIALNGTNDGYLAPLTPVGNWRLSASVPLFNLPLIREASFCLIPYYFNEKSKGESFNHNAGITLTYLFNKFYKFDIEGKRTINPSARYLFGDAFSIGYNFINTANRNQPYVFVSAAFNIGDIKFKPIDEKNTTEVQKK